MYEEKSARITQFSFQQQFCRRQVAKTRLSIELPVRRQPSNVRKINCQPSKTQYWEKLNIEKVTFISYNLNQNYAFLLNERSIQLFRERLSNKSVRAYATMPIGIMGRKSLALLDGGLWCRARRKDKLSIQEFVLFPFTR